VAIVAGLGPGEQVGPRLGERHGPGYDLPAHAEALDRPDDQRPEVGEALARDAEFAWGQIADERTHRLGGRRDCRKIDIELRREATKGRGGVAAGGTLRRAVLFSSALARFTMSASVITPTGRKMLLLPSALFWIFIFGSLSRGQGCTREDVDSITWSFGKRNP
jgi:hypothetical protein